MKKGILCVLSFSLVMVCLLPKTFAKSSNNYNPYGEKVIDLELVPEVNSAMGLDGIVARVDKYDDPLNQITYEMEDGSTQKLIYPVDVKFLNSENCIKDKSNKIYESSVENYAYETKDNDIVSLFPNHSEDGIIVSCSKDIAIKIIPVGKNACPTFLDNHVVYSDVFGDDTSIIFSAFFNGIKDNIKINHPLETYEFNYVVKTNGLAIDEQGIIKRDGVAIGCIDPVTIEDSVGNTEEGDMTVITVEENDEYILNVSVDTEMIEREDMIFPLYIDPVVFFYNGRDAYSNYLFSTTYVNSNNCLTGAYLYPRTTLYVGNYSSSCYRSLIKFPGLDDIINGALEAGLYSANIMVCRAQAYSGNSAVYVEAYPGAYNWSLQTYYSASTCSSIFNDYYNYSFIHNNHTYTSMGRSKINVGALSEGFNSIPLINLVNSGYFSTENGILLKLSDETQVMSYYGTNTAYSSYMPRVAISYSNVETEGIISGGIYRLAPCISQGNISNYALSSSCALSATNDSIQTLTDYPESSYDYYSVIRNPNQLFKITHTSVGYTIQRVTDGYYLKCVNSSSLTFSSNDDSVNYTTRWFIVKNGDHYLIVAYFGSYLSITNMNGIPSLHVLSYNSGVGVLWDFSLYCLGVPYHEQRERNTCGAACIMMIMDWFGVSYSTYSEACIRLLARSYYGNSSVDGYQCALTKIMNDDNFPGLKYGEDSDPDNTNNRAYRYIFLFNNNESARFKLDHGYGVTSEENYYNTFSYNINKGCPVMVYLKISTETAPFSYLTTAHFALVIGVYTSTNTSLPEEQRQRIVLYDPHYNASSLTQPYNDDYGQTPALLDVSLKTFFQIKGAECGLRAYTLLEGYY